MLLMSSSYNSKKIKVFPHSIPLSDDYSSPVHGLSITAMTSVTQAQCEVISPVVRLPPTRTTTVNCTWADFVTPTSGNWDYPVAYLAYIDTIVLSMSLSNVFMVTRDNYLHHGVMAKQSYCVSIKYRNVQSVYF